MVKGFSLIYASFKLVEDGLIQDDPSLIEEGIVFMELSTVEIEAAVKLVK
jgi:hypothetical protein